MISIEDKRRSLRFTKLPFSNGTPRGMCFFYEGGVLVTSLSEDHHLVILLSQTWRIEPLSQRSLVDYKK